MGTWTLNGKTFEQLAIVDAEGIGDWSAGWTSLATDTLQFNDPAAAFDGVLRWPFDTEMILALDGVVQFRGRVREYPRNLGTVEETITYKAIGAWGLLDEHPYVQFFEAADDPDAAIPVIVKKYQGRIVLGQADDGQKVTIADMVRQIIGSAIEAGCPITLGVVEGLDYKVTWDEVADLSHAQALARALQLATDAVVFWDYTQLLPSFNVTVRPLMTAVNLNVPGQGEGGTGVFAPFESILLDEQTAKQVTGVVLFYIRTARDNGNASRDVEVDAYPVGTDPRSARVLARTITLAGAISNQTRLQQPTVVKPISANLVSEDKIRILNSGGTVNQFGSMSLFWKRKLPFLSKPGIEIVGFLNGERELAEPKTTIDEHGGEHTTTDIDPECERELTGGAVNEWMQKNDGIKAEYQKISVQCRYNIVSTDDSLATPKKELKHDIFTATVTATNAQNHTYDFLQSSSFTEEEATPDGLAERLYRALSEPQFDGSFVIVGVEATMPVRIGQLVNLICAAQPTWAGMRALIQSIQVDGKSGRLTVTVRPVKVQSFNDLTDVWRTNRESEPVTSAMVRTGGAASPGVGLATYSPRNDASVTAAPPIQGTAPVTPAAIIATPDELVAAVQKYYKDLDIDPKGGDYVNITIAGKGKFRAYVHTANSNLPAGWSASFTLDTTPGQTYWITLSQLGIY